MRAIGTAAAYWAALDRWKIAHACWEADPTDELSKELSVADEALTVEMAHRVTIVDDDDE